MVLWEAVRERGERLPIPDDPLEELGLLHGAITALAEHEQPFAALCYMYGRVQGFEESVAEVLHDVAGRYVSHLNRVIEIALLDSNDPAYGPARRIDIRVDGGTNQWNLAQDGSRIDATQHVSDDALAIIRAAEQLARAAMSSHDDGDAGIDREEVREIAATIIAEMQSGSPKRFTLKAASERLTQVAAVSTAASAIITHAGTLVTLLHGWLAALR